MAEEAVKLSVSSDIVERIVKSEISTAVLKGLNTNVESIIHDLVGQVLELKVTADGKVGSSHYENKHTFLQYIVGNAIRTQARDALTEWLESNKPKVKKAIEASLTKRMSAISDDYVRALLSASKDNYRFTMNLMTEHGYKEYGALNNEINELKKQIKEMKETKAK